MCHYRSYYMKKGIITIGLLGALLAFYPASGFAQPKDETKVSVSKASTYNSKTTAHKTYVKGYCKKNGTCVKGHWRKKK